MIPEKLMEQAAHNLMLRSRTANGIVDTSSSEGKEDLLLVKSGDAARDAALRNFEKSLEYAWEMKDAPLDSPEEIKKIIETIASFMDQGIVKEGNLLRTLDSERYNYVPAAMLSEDLDLFYRSLWERLMQEPGDPVADAAYAEFAIDIRGHYFSDGCGKTSLVTACWVLFRRNHHLPEYKGGREAFYSVIKASEKESGIPGAGQKPFEKFLDFYRGLFHEETH